MVTEHKTLFEILQNIDTNKYVMPAFQRNYEWDLDRIEKLWDSILQGYPFSTFLFWELDSDNVSQTNYFYVFARECCFKKNGDNKGCEYDRNTIDFSKEGHPTIAVLDGQQRLTSLFLSLMGNLYKEPRKGSSRYPIKLFIELDESKIDENNAFNSKKYGIYFSEKVALADPGTRFEIKKIMDPVYRDSDTREIAIDEVIAKVPAMQKAYAKEILNRLCEAIYDQKLVVYTKVSNLTQDDALEMFVRFNSGGKNLTKAQISMSILEVFWPNVQKDFESVLVGKFANFGTDFILRTAHMIYGDVISSNIDQVFAQTFRSYFDKFKQSLEATEELFSMMKYDIAKFSSKWNVVIPIIYLIYNNDQYIENIQGLFAYLFRSILFNFYSSGTTSKLKKMRDLIYQNYYTLTPEMIDTIPDLEARDSKIDDLLLAEKDSILIGNILYCLALDWYQEDLDYDEDHIHPDARFARARPINMTEGEWILARNSRNRLPNIQLLKGDQNRSKGDIDFDRYYMTLNPVLKAKMKEEGLIPEPPEGMEPSKYYNIENYKNFYEDRKTILKEKLRFLLNGLK